MGQNLVCCTFFLYMLYIWGPKVWEEETVGCFYHMSQYSPSFGRINLFGAIKQYLGF